MLKRLETGREEDHRAGPLLTLRLEFKTCLGAGCRDPQLRGRTAAKGQFQKKKRRSRRQERWSHRGPTSSRVEGPLCQTTQMIR